MKIKGYYISRNYKSLYNAAGKAKTDCEYSFNLLGFKNLGFKQSSIPNSALGTLKNFFGITIALLRLPFKSTLITQYPNNKFRKYICVVARFKACKIITVVHDVRTLKGREKDINNELKRIVTDVIIVHNPTMKQWFLDQNVKIPIKVLEIFDYIANDRPTQNDEHIKEDVFDLVYAGGFGYEKNGYLFELDNLNHQAFKLKLYGVGYNDNMLKAPKQNSIVSYEGSFPSYEIAYKMKAHFGLVWDGVSTETCSGQYGEYLKFNNPHKTSLYLLAGIPVLIWDKAALAPFIVNNGYGIAVSNLSDLDTILSKISSKDYIKIKQNVKHIQYKLKEGYFITQALKACL